MDNIFSREERLSGEELGEDTTNTPDVNGGSVLGEEGATELGGSVPAGGNVVSPEDGSGGVVEGDTSKAEVADLELAVSIGEDVLGLEIAVEDIGSVDVLEAAQQLVEEELVVLRGQVVICLYHLVQVRLHQLKHHIDVPELPPRCRQQDVLYLHNVWVAQQPVLFLYKMKKLEGEKKEKKSEHK